MLSLLMLAMSGFVAGLIDSVAGGGGLITLPSLMLVVGAGPLAVGSNKIPGFVAAISALAIYWRGGHLWLRTGLLFSLTLFLGAWGGSTISPRLPPEAFKALLVLSAPLVIFLVFSRSVWMTRDLPQGLQKPDAVGVPAMLKLGALGFAVGLYDGAWGPGGGTFMFLALLLGAKVPLLPAMATAKLANASSAGGSLINYSIQGWVSPLHGGVVAVGSAIGAVLGAKLAGRFAEQLVRPALLLISVLLLVKVLSD